MLTGQHRCRRCLDHWSGVERAECPREAVAGEVAGAGVDEFGSHGWGAGD